MKHRSAHNWAAHWDDLNERHRATVRRCDRRKTEDSKEFVCFLGSSSHSPLGGACIWDIPDSCFCPTGAGGDASSVFIYSLRSRCSRCPEACLPLTRHQSRWTSASSVTTSRHVTHPADENPSDITVRVRPPPPFHLPFPWNHTLAFPADKHVLVLICIIHVNPYCCLHTTTNHRSGQNNAPHREEKCYLFCLVIGIITKSMFYKRLRNKIFFKQDFKKNLSEKCLCLLIFIHI